MSSTMLEAIIRIRMELQFQGMCCKDFLVSPKMLKLCNSSMYGKQPGNRDEKMKNSILLIFRDKIIHRFTAHATVIECSFLISFVLLVGVTERGKNCVCICLEGISNKSPYAHAHYHFLRMRN